MRLLCATFLGVVKRISTKSYQVVSRVVTLGNRATALLLAQVIAPIGVGGAAGSDRQGSPDWEVTGNFDVH